MNTRVQNSSSLQFSSCAVNEALNELPTNSGPEFSRCKHLALAGDLFFGRILTRKQPASIIGQTSVVKKTRLEDHVT